MFRAGSNPTTIFDGPIITSLVRTYISIIDCALCWSIINARPIKRERKKKKNVRNYTLNVVGTRAGFCTRIRRRGRRGGRLIPNERQQRIRRSAVAGKMRFRRTCYARVFSVAKSRNVVLCVNVSIFFSSGKSTDVSQNENSRRVSTPLANRDYRRPDYSRAFRSAGHTRPYTVS